MVDQCCECSKGACAEGCCIPAAWLVGVNFFQGLEGFSGVAYQPECCTVLLARLLLGLWHPMLVVGSPSHRGWQQAEIG